MINFFKIIIVWLLFFALASDVSAQQNITWWNVQSIDTMKFSRDLAREKATDPTFNQEIDRQILKIVQTGATHVAIGTPYDEEFIPFIQKWVQSARRHNLNVWFRGNFAGWENWFGYEDINREQHIKLTQEFILKNNYLFEDGDIFTSCTECENGGPGDPRFNDDVNGHREFLIEEYKVAKESFRKLGRDVRSNFYSMNGDVARLIMNKETTRNLGGIVVVDHYVQDPKEFADDIREIAEISGGKVVIGEFGAPIPEIHESFDNVKQAEWIEETLTYLSDTELVEGINYWVGFGGSTRLWEENGNETLAADVIKGFYTPSVISTKVVNELNVPIEGAKVYTENKTAKTQKDGKFVIAYLPVNKSLKVSRPGYKSYDHEISDVNMIILEKERENIGFKVIKKIYKFFTNLSLTL